jgi:hypothetical protein
VLGIALAVPICCSVPAGRAEEMAKARNSGGAKARVGSLGRGFRACSRKFANWFSNPAFLAGGRYQTAVAQANHPVEFTADGLRPTPDRRPGV